MDAVLRQGYFFCGKNISGSTPDGLRVASAGCETLLAFPVHFNL
jgi:hypothetical protein